jgi:hypothetical protein
VQYETVTAVDQWITITEFSPAVAVVADLLPARFQLYSAFPNPFRNGTTIRYDIPRTSDVELRIYDVAGRLVRTLTRTPATPPGRYRTVWDARNGSGRFVASGVYFYRLDAGDFRDVRKIVLIR